MSVNLLTECIINRELKNRVFTLEGGYLCVFFHGSSIHYYMKQVT